jgi:DNA polymerase-1
MRKSVQYYSEKIRFIETEIEAQNMVELAYQRPLSHIGFDTEFRYNRPGVKINKRNTACDPRSIHPLLLSLAMFEPTGVDQGRLYNFVVDLRNPELVPVLSELFRLPCCFCGHHTKVELFCLWQLGVMEPRCIWDSIVFEKALHLGLNHPKYNINKKTDEQKQIKVKKESDAKKQFGNTLVATSHRYGIAHAMEREKERLQQSFLKQNKNDAFSKEQIRYAAEDAVTAAKLYPLQIQKAAQKGLLHHCVSIEMPWVTTNARIEWNGVKIDTQKRDAAMSALKNQKAKLEHHLKEAHGIKKIASHKQLSEFFKNEGLLHAFQEKGKISFDKKSLKKNSDLHPIIPLIRTIRKITTLIADKVMSPEFIGADGRMHATHQQLGTDTGRQTSKWPNFLGLDRILRPLIIPKEGYGIGEADWSSVEIGISAAIYNDGALIKMFNTGDIYSSMAQHFFRKELSKEDLALTGNAFKIKYPKLRDKMKACTLGIIYGITPVGLSKNLGTTQTKAAKLQNQFANMFPQLKQGLAKAFCCGAIRSYGQTITGLRRNRGKSGTPSHWERNWLANHPIQGSAAAVFKVAGNRLDKLYQQHDARIIIPLHDSFVFEAPLAELEAVAQITSRTMCDTLQEFFPALQPRVEVNISRPHCWNKAGETEALEQWIEMPAQIEIM